ncbi:MAG: phosphotransferase [Anaerolineales bacterium]|nr:phosphotransferase [Anaerolineales bacterium]
MNQKPRILLVENDPRAREAYSALLKYWNYDPILAVGEGWSLIEDARAKARQARCLLALIDLHLLDDYDEDDTSGLKLATQVGTIRAIILSGNPNQTVLLEMLDKHKDIHFINKGASAEEKRRILDTEMAKISAVKRGLHISPPELMNEIAQTTFGALTGEYSDQVADTLAQLFPNATGLWIEKLDAGSSVSHASVVPRPNSVVLRVAEDDLEPVVVKLARAGKIGIEVRCYEKFIFRRLPGSFIARLERFAIQWDIGGALYSYIGDFDVKTFSRYYQERPIEDIRECLNSFFTVSWRRHYERGRDQSNISLFDLYGLVWGNWYEKRVKNFRSRASLYDPGVHQKLGLPEPIEWFKKNIAENRAKDLSFVENTRIAVTHGDLHGDNLLIDSQRNAWVIDFERTGEGHALQDFIELESDIINRLEAQAHSGDTSSYYRMCLTVASQTEIRELERSEMESADPGIRKALQTISILRSLARQCTEITDARQYLLGLLFNTIFRATINNNEKHHERQSRALILAGIFCHRLDHWNDPWPPEEWQHILNTRRNYA